ncbi:flagellar hook capping FlgD N-terminal domain-containing protein [Paracoccus sp. SCSIO 75233]|uniref:flagellar hook capping FlgD N-terminal domain-containing protein n=1 Tax=Paracoccus sp. SCSIO 75233 TaxID=3017782 RepID=UPI0022F0B1DC|nr:flagellar hook capping FlgD N-terminal domain-containing protein [Paracoccus sp. SCSIO 75233]WBU53275.1 flagellar basal body rod modification protein [Paracoccus sp. SCSIO 75233]
MTSTAPVGPTPATQTTSSDKPSFAGGNFETFLKMLTTQIRNQDPLNPMEGADFAVQTATFSGVEQQVRTNDLLQKMAGGSGDCSLTSFAGWIGTRVKTTGGVYFADRPLVMDIQPEISADRVMLITQDASGAQISVEDIGTGRGLVEWFGKNGSGQQLDPGVYTFRLASYRGDTLISEKSVPVYSQVDEVARQGKEIVLSLEGGATAKISDITAISAGD